MITSTPASNCKPGYRTREDRILVVLLLLLTLFVYAQTVSHDFITIDDGPYVFENRHVLAGLTPGGVRWALTTFAEANWHPLTWLSLMADAEAARWLAAFDIAIGNERAGVFHLTNVILHAANVVLLFVVLNALTGMPWRSAFVAALFAAHPLHVESVAWVTERKDVLSTLFWLLTMLAYIRYVARPGRRALGLAILCFGLGLMAKPMLVTLPVVLLLIDLWPLGRSRTQDEETPGAVARRLVIEKLPLFALSLCSCLLTIYVQRSGGAMVSTERWPFMYRLDNAIVSYGAYVVKTFWPVGLGVIYPIRLIIPRLEVAASRVFLVTVTLLAIRAVRRPSLRWATVGWFWYLITLLPVVGLIQVGAQAMADRYMYVPSIGLFIAVAWGVPTALERIRSASVRTAVVRLSAASSLVILTVLAYVQTGCWTDSIGLYEQTLQVTKDNVYVEFNLGAALYDAGRTEESVPHFARAAQLRPRYAMAHGKLGTALASLGKPEEAEKHLRQSVKLNPRVAEMHNNLGAVLLSLGKPREALPHFEAAVELKPDYEGARSNLEQTRMIVGE